MRHHYGLSREEFLDTPVVLLEEMMQYLPQLYFKSQFPTLRLIHTVIGALGGKAQFDELIPPWATFETGEQIPAAVVADLSFAIKHGHIRAGFISTLFWRYGESQLKEALNGRSD